MSRSFHVHIETGAYATVKVVLSDAQLMRVAVDLEKPVDELTIEDLAEMITDNSDEPTICAQCSGWRRDYSLELGEIWDASLTPSDAPLHSAIEEVEK